jgi:hypothetical protein
MTLSPKIILPPWRGETPIVHPPRQRRSLLPELVYQQPIFLKIA